jgi:hypothetical protein
MAAVVPAAVVPDGAANKSIKARRGLFRAVASLNGILNNVKEENKAAVILGVSVLALGAVAGVMGTSVSIWKAAHAVIKDDKSNRQESKMYLTDLITSSIGGVIFLVLTILALLVNRKLLKQL